MKLAITNESRATGVVKENRSTLKTFFPAGLVARCATGKDSILNN
jgi:hypothetical protein